MRYDVVYIDQDGIESLIGFERTKDAFGIPLQFATRFWGDDPLGDIAKYQLIETYGPKIEALIEQQKKDGECFSSMKEAKEKFNKSRRYYIDTLLYVYLDQRQSDDSFFTSTGDQDGVFVLMGMSTSKLVLNKRSVKMMLIESRQLRVWGYLIELSPNSFQIKPHMVWHQ
ncbi:MAG: hypothetical protein LBU37_00640 [Tannerellaceae bacterium]|nr:hypothetical protein [Tannerellaceae bacterium]